MINKLLCDSISSVWISSCIQAWEDCLAESLFSALAVRVVHSLHPMA